MSTLRVWGQAHEDDVVPAKRKDRTMHPDAVQLGKGGSDGERSMSEK